MPRCQGPQASAAEVLEAARDMEATLSTIGLKCFLVGGLACYLYGNTRAPSDIDMVVLETNLPQESLKRRLCLANSRFYLVSSTNPLASYKVVWYRRHPTANAVKTDLLQPGIYDIPSLPTSVVLKKQGISCAPLSAVILLKLRAWADHKASTKSYYSSRQWTDHADLIAMLSLAKRASVKLDAINLDPGIARLVTLMQSRIGRHCLAYPEMRVQWGAIGVKISRFNSSLSSSFSTLSLGNPASPSSSRNGSLFYTHSRPPFTGTSRARHSNSSLNATSGSLYYGLGTRSAHSSTRRDYSMTHYGL